MKHKRIYRIFFLIVLFVMAAGMATTVNAAEISKMTEYESKTPSKQKMYQSYYNKLMEIEETYKVDSPVLGLRFAKLIDFNDDGTEELLFTHIDSFDSSGAKYVLEVWKNNGAEIEKVFERECYVDLQQYVSIKLYFYGNQYFIGQSFNGPDECAEWLYGDKISDVQWDSGFVLMGFDGDNFAPVQSLFFGYDSDNQERYNLNGECMSQEDIENSENYAKWLAYTENPKISFLTCDSDGGTFNGTPEELEEIFLMLRNTDDSTGEDNQVYENTNVDFCEGVYRSGENRLVIVKDTYCYKVSMLIFRFTTLDSVGSMNGRTMFLYDNGWKMNSHISWTDENTCIYTLDDEVFSESGMPTGTNFEFVRSDTETIDDYVDFIR